MKNVREYPAFHYVKDLAYQMGILKRSAISFPDVFKQTNSIFIHVPKCAGNAVTNALYGQDSVKICAHATAQELQSADPDAFKMAFKFAVVRHPVSRFVSAFEFIKSGGMTVGDRGISKAFFPSNMDILEFIDRVEQPAYRKYVMQYFHFMPQSHYLCDENGSLMVDKLILQENLHDEIEALRKLLGFGNEIRVVNATRKRETRSEPPQKVIEFVNKYYVNDFRIWIAAQQANELVERDA
jgi:hypothetical protein